MRHPKICGFILFWLNVGILAAPISALAAEEHDNAVSLKNSFCQINFDRDSGVLKGICNASLHDECLKELTEGQFPFRIYLDFRKEYELGDDPAAIAQTVLNPDNCKVKAVRQEENRLSLLYAGQDLEIELGIAMERDSGYSDWSLKIRNTGPAPQAILPVFPWLGGIHLGETATGNLATIMNQAGTYGPAWEQHGGFCGHGGQWSMQWHALWDPATKSAFGLIVMDPEAKAKQLRLNEPAIEVAYFPPLTLAPGASFELPSVRLLVYTGDWRPAARAYRAWYDKAYPHAGLPQWFQDCDSWEGRHYKKGGPGIQPENGTQTALESFSELPRAHLRLPFDNTEYAFYSRGSMLYGVHTDGDNVVREDMGGAAAMREGIVKVHQLGRHLTLYIEGYIVYKESELAKSGKAERWSIMNKEGNINGPYTKQGFFHMCPGCVEWQDHLVETAGRLLRDTGADGIRLDSLGFYFLPCYNPAHKHPSPFGYNEWIKQLLMKVRAAALAVNPNALLTTEAPVDWYGQWFHGALTQVYPRDLPSMRLAVGPYRSFAYSQAGQVWGSVAGLAGGRIASEQNLETLEGNWLCARHPVHKALAEGDVADNDPKASDPQVVARQFKREDYWAVVVLRSACAEPLQWPAATGLSDKHDEYSLAVTDWIADIKEPLTISLCDVQTLTWSPLEAERSGDSLVFHLTTNWALIVLSEAGGPNFVDIAQPAAAHPGESLTLQISPIAPAPPVKAPLKVQLTAPGLIAPSELVSAPGEVTVQIPPEALPGYYSITLSGNNLLGAKRFIKVE
ncbi:MAG TPA: DUF6259 domain-containing protein [Candidatus Hydrogenedentes bacterium]|nr:DUF6259 domain-containing protein [Candidatus Hydrogenedentota bacterium]